ncbi:arsenate reductase ArsC [Methanobacterium aggregans]|uniref:arsenate reductase ArsC n=1 Tax=Methanobacterium aggregans TaxID=1615586 RepID=UPI00320FF174
MIGKEKILIICTNNSSRSQMAEGYFKHAHGEYYDVHSAGTEPTTVNPYAVKVMKELGIDISDHRSKSLKEFEGQEFDQVITVCGGAKEACPFFPGAKNYMHHGFKDPACVNGTQEEKMNVFREVRDEIIFWINETFKKK